MGPSLALLRAMLKLSRAMVGHVEAVCQMLFGHVVGFVPQSPLPQKHHDFKWPRLGPSLAILGPVKVSGSYSSASWGKVGGS